ncbi:hypothetical protein ACQB60_38085 [Actinomycetota bacterium Odt1-20B]
MEQFRSTEAVLTAIRELARAHGRDIEVSHDIGADQTSRRSATGVGVTTDPDGSLPHEAYVDFTEGSPRISVHLYPDDDALITIETVDCPDVARDDVPAFLRSVLGGLAYVKGRRFPPGYRFIVPLPGDRTHKEYMPMITLTPWLSSKVR